MEINQAIHSSGNLHIFKPRKALNKAFLKVKPNRSQIEQFKENLIQLLDRTNDHESEEFHKAKKVQLIQDIGDYQNDEKVILEAEIDQLVYELYGLTEEEIGIVEGKWG